MKKKEQQERDFERLVERQRQTFYSVCYLFANERQQADDLFQEVLIRLYISVVQQSSHVLQHAHRYHR